MSGSSRGGTPAKGGPLPRILCLHGGGTSAKIFSIQTVRFQRMLKDHFQFVFVDAPFESPAGPGVSPFFDEMGPFYSWLRRKPGELGEQVTARIENAIRGHGEGVVQGMTWREGDRPGPIVGVLGFSQGAGIGAGLLLQQQAQTARGERGYGLRFGVMCMAAVPPTLPATGSIAQPPPPRQTFVPEWEHAVELPTLHVHGLQDQFYEGIATGMRHFKPGTTQLLEFSVEHRLPISDADNERVSKAIIDLYERTKP